MLYYSADQPSQPKRGGVTALDQEPLTRLRAVRVPPPPPQTFSRHIESSQHVAETPASSHRFVVVPAFAAPSGHVNSDGYALLQLWEGQVLAADGGNVTAVVRDWTNPTMPDEEVTVSIDEFAPDEQVLVTPGAVFYWSIGYRTRGGTRERVSAFQLRRLPPPSKAERERAKKEAVALSALLGARRSI